MGLDMYLHGALYISRYAGLAESIDGYRREFDAADRVLDALDLPKPPVDGGLEVKVPVGYWRKANHIHGWFVDNVQGGTDDCGTYDVGLDQLRELRAVCREVLESVELVDGEVTNGYRIDQVAGEVVRDPIIEPGAVIANPGKALELLPPREGFFFGSNEPNQWYVQDVVDTIEVVGWAEAHADRFSWFQYHSSW